MRRVAVTGLGVICALGGNVTDVWSAACNGCSALQPIASVDVSNFRFRNGAEVRGYDPSTHFAPSRLDLLDRFAQFAVIAARQAIADSGIELSSALRDRAAVVTGTGAGGLATVDQAMAGLYGGEHRRPHPFTVPRTMGSAGASHISMEFGLTGPAFTVSTACSSSNHAIGQAFWMVRSGQVDLAIAGGSEAPFSNGILRAWESMRVVSPTVCRPFCQDRDGMILGEGAAMLVLENMDAAVARGAHVYGEVAGFGMSADANHITQPSADGPIRAMRAALADADLEAAEIGYINAHGTGTRINDPIEAQAIRQIFGSHTNGIAVSSTKSMHGHALGAAGAIEAVLTLLALQKGVLPPTVNFTQLDPDCDLDVIANQPRYAKVEYALSNSFAFGGLNAVLAFRSPAARSL